MNCPTCDRPDCKRDALREEVRLAGAACIGTELSSGPDPGESAAAWMTREEPIKAAWRRLDLLLEQSRAAERDCWTHAVDWRARALAAEEEVAAFLRAEMGL